MASVFFGLAVLVCPVAMGLMMAMMMRGQKRGSTSQTQGHADLAVVDALKDDRAAHTHQQPQP